MSAAFSDHLLVRLAATKKDAAAAGAASSALTMNLRNPVGTTPHAPFEMENKRPEPVTALFRLTPYVSEDGSQLVPANHAFGPSQAVVPAGGGAGNALAGIAAVGEDPRGLVIRKWRSAELRQRN
ncbi:MAG: hypothetical protein GEU92_00885 [Alphaproteobacteria bacterium]|nr:hypothetical protein [Alphaproteobacteria bacterium]